MGWASGTSLFDGAVRVALEHAPVHNTDDGAQVRPHIRRKIIQSMYRAFDDYDWDTEDESEFFESDLIHIMRDLGRIDDEWYEEFLSRNSV